MIEIIFAQDHIHNGTFQSHYLPMIGMHPIGSQKVQNFVFHTSHEGRPQESMAHTYIHLYIGRAPFWTVCMNSLVGPPGATSIMGEVRDEKIQMEPTCVNIFKSV